MSNLQYAKNSPNLLCIKRQRLSPKLFTRTRRPSRKKRDTRSRIRFGVRLDQLVHRLLKLGERDGIRSIL
jgi:hypothetical protein